MGIGNNIKFRAKEKNISLKKLAEMTDISYNTLYSITKRDSNRVQGDILKAIADALSVSTDTLMGIEEDTSVSDFQEVIDWLDVAGFSVEKHNEYDVWRILDSNGNDVGLYNEYDLISIFKKIIEDGDTLKHDFIIQKIKLLFRK